MPAIGVDFGNFKTCVGAFGEKGQVEILNKIPYDLNFVIFLLLILFN